MKSQRVNQEIKQTRIKLVLLGLGLFFIEGIIKTVFSAFPIIELLSAEGGLILGYITGKSYENGKFEEENKR